MLRVLKNLITLLIFSLLASSAWANDSYQIGVDGQAFRSGRDVIFTYMEGSFGAYLLLCCAFSTIISVAFGMYSQAKYLLIVSVGIFVTRSVTFTFFPDINGKFIEVSNTGGAGPGSSNTGPGPAPEPEPSTPPQPSSEPSPEKSPTAKPTKSPTSQATKEPTQPPTPAPTNTVAPTATSKPTKVPTIAPTVEQAKCRGGRMCYMTGSSCSCSSRLEGDDPNCVFMFNGRPCRFTR